MAEKDRGSTYMFRAPVDLLDRLAAAAAQEQRSMAFIVREALQEWLDRHRYTEAENAAWYQAKKAWVESLSTDEKGQM